MFHKYYLTERDQLTLDPTGRARQHYSQYKVARPGTASPYVTYDDADISKFVSRNIGGDPHNFYHNANRDALKKVGPQGGCYSFTELEQLVLEYYQDVTVTIDPYLIMARDWLVRCIRQYVEDFGYPGYVEPQFYSTSASLPTMSKKGTYEAETVSMLPHRHLLPAVAGERIQNGKHRVIFMDPVANVRLMEQGVKQVKIILKRLFPQYFCGWFNPDLYLVPQISKAVCDKRVAIEGDYKSMDKRFTFPLVRELLLPIYEAALPSGEFQLFAAATEELFQQELYMGDYILSGWHGIFSGQDPYD